jgi:hypothetical protein
MTQETTKPIMISPILANLFGNQVKRKSAPGQRKGKKELKVKWGSRKDTQAHETLKSSRQSISNAEKLLSTIHCSTL